jgi:hypothetical protein
VIPSNILHDLQWLHELLGSDIYTISYFIHYGTLGKGVGKDLQGIILKNESYCEASEKFPNIDCSLSYFLLGKHCYFCLFPLLWLQTGNDTY